MKSKKNKQRKFDEILLDLLSSGLGATIILMLIFSLNLTGLFSYKKPTSFEAPYPNVGDASLLAKDRQKRKSMSSIRFVTIYGDGKEIYDQLIDNDVELENCWQRTGWNDKDDDFKALLKELNESYQVEVKENSITFYYFIDHALGEIQFILDPAIHLKRNYRVKAAIIEGKSTVPSEALVNGIYGGREETLIDDRDGLLVQFKNGTLRSKSLIRIK